MVDESIVLETRDGIPTVTVPHESPEFAKLAGSVHRYLLTFGLTEALRALDTMQEVVQQWDDIKGA